MVPGSISLQAFEYRLLGAAGMDVTINDKPCLKDAQAGFEGSYLKKLDISRLTLRIRDSSSLITLRS